MKKRCRSLPRFGIGANKLLEIDALEDVWLLETIITKDV
jgi:hypothetical protein